MVTGQEVALKIIDKSKVRGRETRGREGGMGGCVCEGEGEKEEGSFPSHQLTHSTHPHIHTYTTRTNNHATTQQAVKRTLLQLRTEILALKTLRHPNVLELLQVGGHTLCVWCVFIGE